MSTITALIFDVDGTLYRSPQSLQYKLNEYWIRQVAERLRVSEEEARVMYDKKHHETKSATLALAQLGLGDIQGISVRADKYSLKEKKEYIKHDRKLVTIIKKLRAQYRLFTLRNGTAYGTRSILSLLGFENSRLAYKPGFGPFDGILPTSEIGAVKPETVVFTNALRTMRAPASEIVIIGDRIEVDLVPAKKLGMKTVFVSWGAKTKKNSSVDAVIETIYDIRELLDH